MPELVQLTPAVAARLHTGPRYHQRARKPEPRRLEDVIGESLVRALALHRPDARLFAGLGIVLLASLCSRK